MADEEQRARDELARLSDAAAQAGLQTALALKLEREKALAAQRSEYDDLTARLRASDEHRLQIERASTRCAQRITELQLKEQAARLGLEQYTHAAGRRAGRPGGRGASIADGNVRAGRPAGRNRPHAPRDRRAGRGQPGGAGRTDAARERKIFLDAQTADLTEAMNTLEDAIRKIDGETRELLRAPSTRVNDHFGRMFPELFGGGNAQAGHDRRRNPRLRRAGDGAATRQEEPDHPPAVGRRKGADRDCAGVCHLPAQSGAVLPARRGGRAAGRRQHRALCQAGHRA